MTPSIDAGRRLRVLMVMPSYYPVVGGMEIQIERQIPHLRAHGIDVAVLTRRVAGTAPKEQHCEVEIRRIAAPGPPGLRSLAFTTLGSVDIVRERRSIDVIHAHSILSPTTIAAITGTLLRKPTVVTPHQSYEPEHLLSKPLGKARLQLYRRIISRFVSISSDIEHLLRQHEVPSARIASIPNGIETQHFRPAIGCEKASLRTALGLPLDQPIVVFAGRLQPVKQVDVLLDAWTGVSNGHLVILGDGQERQALEEQTHALGLGGRVEFRGIVPDVADYLRASEVFVLPSSSEGLSVALLEAMSSGMFPIATAIGGTTDLIEDGVTGLLVTSGDRAGLETALTRALDAPDWVRDVSTKARARVVESYDIQVIAAKLAAVYRDVAAKRRN